MVVTTNLYDYNFFKDIVDETLKNFNPESYLNYLTTIEECAEWVFWLDNTKGIKFPSDDDCDEVLFVGNGSMSVIPIFNRFKEYRYIENIKEFHSFKKNVVDLPQIISAQFFSLTNIMCLEHNDYGNENYNRVIFNLNVPDTKNCNLCGIKVDKNTILPVEDDILLFDHKIRHAAWNFTQQQWTFLSFDVIVN